MSTGAAYASIYGNPLPKPANQLDCKIVMLGASGVGKSCIVSRFCLQRYPATIAPTLSYEFLGKATTTSGGRLLGMQLWDTFLERHRLPMPRGYYRGAKAALFVFDVTREDTLNYLVENYNRVTENLDPEVVIAVVGNKCDCSPSFDLAKAKEFAEQKADMYFGVSALSGAGVEALFQAVSERVSEAYPPGWSDTAVMVGNHRNDLSSSSCW